MNIDSPSVTEAPLDHERVRKAAPTLLMCLSWLYGLELAPDDYKRSDDFADQMNLAMRAAQLAIADATGLEPETRQ
jgi:hypothetical protein